MSLQVIQTEILRTTKSICDAVVLPAVTLICVEQPSTVRQARCRAIVLCLLLSAWDLLPVRAWIYLFDLLIELYPVVDISQLENLSDNRGGST